MSEHNNIEKEIEKIRSIIDQKLVEKFGNRFNELVNRALKSYETRTIDYELYTMNKDVLEKVLKSVKTLRNETSSEKIKQEYFENTGIFYVTIKKGKIIVMFTAIYGRVTSKYGKRGRRYVHMEAGHSSENIYLQSEALGLGTVSVGAFKDEKISKIIDCQDSEKPLYLMPIGKE